MWNGEVRKSGYLSGKVGFAFTFLQTSCAIWDGVFCALVGLAGLELWKESVLLFFLLGKVLVESECVVLFIWISVSSARTVWFFGIGVGGVLRGCTPVTGGGIRRSSPVASGGICGSAPVAGGGLCGGSPVIQAAGLGSGVGRCGLLNLEFSISIVAAPTVVYFLVRVAAGG